MAECEQSLNGKHHYKMIKSGMHPEYCCEYCYKNRPKTMRCPDCGHLIEINETSPWD